MRDLIKMVIVLAIIAGASGFLLNFVKDLTADTIEEQELFYVKGPAISKVLDGSENDPIKDRMTVDIDGKELTVFPGKREGKIWAIAFESFEKGYGGDIGVITGIDVYSEKLSGIGITTLKETPGLGARVAQPQFMKNFDGLELSQEQIKVRADGGKIDAVSGASISSRAVCRAVSKSVELFKKEKDKFIQN